jgi:hypothetical protein
VASRYSIPPPPPLHLPMPHMSCTHYLLHQSSYVATLLVPSIVASLLEFYDYKSTFSSQVVCVRIVVSYFGDNHGSPCRSKLDLMLRDMKAIPTWEVNHAKECGDQIGKLVQSLSLYIFSFAI